MLTCRHAGVCGGCSLLHLSYTDQLARKTTRLNELLGDVLPSRSLAEPASLFLPVDHADSGPAHFRHKVSFVFDNDPRSAALLMGHHERGTKRVVPVSECPVHSVRGNRIAFTLRDYLATARIEAAGPSLSGILRYVIVRTTADEREAVAMLVVTRNDKSLRAPLRAFLASPERPDGLFVNINDDPGPLMVGDRTIKIAGRAQVREQVGGVSYLISPTAFFQTSPAAAAVLQRAVVDSMRGCASVLDLYCGSGLFSLPLAMAGARVFGIEENRQAIEDAERNARLNNVPSSRVRFRSARVEDAVRTAARERWDGVVLDPPRSGCSDDVLEAVFQDLRPARVTYVSCNPESLAMELPGILQCGYRVTQLNAVDMFPHTDHIEAIVQLSRD
ncbi:MAG: 23S rRNA (uracil(1939)-C(5))-methyltransferase RlmD [Vicinamibacterales bacterium]